MSDDYHDFLVNASKGEVIQQLNTEVRQPLIDAQNLVNMLLLTVNPSPSMAKKMESGEVNPPAMLEQIAQDLARVFEVIDFYRETLDT
jgi:hypothetical protein